MANVLTCGGELSLFKAITIFQHWLSLNQKCPLEDQPKKSRVERLEDQQQEQIIVGQELELISE
jgi:hypothetical protein